MSIITEYLEDIDKFINQIPYRLSNKIQADNRGSIVLYLKGEIVFTDGSILYFKEYFIVISRLKKLAYSYHYQNSNNELVFRYDNAEHHPEVKTFPHHKHQIDSVIPSKENSLKSIINDVLNILSGKLSK